MPSATLSRLVSRCRGLAVPDAELVRRFARSADADAFAVLVGRYAGLVWGVCRRTLPQEADAEDAFQATFLALARQARSIDPLRPLAAWLHAVAVRVSRRALGKTLRRRTSELPETVGPSDVVRDVTSRDLFRAVDEEIERLPAVLRGPVVLCCLEGRARDEAAEMLGCSVPAVKARLERARQTLRRALTRRGIALPAAFFALGLGTGRVNAALTGRAVKAALGSPSPAVAALAAGTSTHLGLFTVALSAAVAIGVAAFGLGQGQQQNPPPPDSRSESATLSARSASGGVDKFGDPLPEGAVRRFGTLRFRHEAVGALAFTPDGKRLVAGVGGRTILAVIDPADGRKLAQIGPMDSNCNDEFALSPDGKHVYCIGSRLIKRDLATGAKVRQFEADDCQTVAVSPDGKKLAVAREVDRKAQGGSAMIFDAQTGEKLVDLHPKDLPANKRGPDVRRMAFSPDGKMVAAVVSDPMPIGVRLWEVATGKTLATVAPAGDVPYTFAFIPGTKLLACLGSEGVIHLWDTEAGKFTRTIPLPKDDDDFPMADLQVSADGKRAAGVYLRRGIVVVFDPKTGKELRRLTGCDSTTGNRALALSPDGALVAGGWLGGNSTVRVWEVDSGKERLADAGHRGPATLSLSADGKTLISRGAGQVFHWNLTTGEGKARPDDVKDPDGQVPTWSSKWTYRAGRYRMETDWMEYGPGQMVVRTRDGSKLIAKTSCPKEHIHAVVYSPDGRTVAVAFQDGGGFTILLWSPETRAEPFRLAGHPDSYQQMTFTHDGKYLIAGAGTFGNAYRTETVFIYETPTGKLVRKLATHRATGHLLITADDRTLITGQWDDATVKVWDLATGTELGVLVDPGVKVPPPPAGPGDGVDRWAGPVGRRALPGRPYREGGLLVRERVGRQVMEADQVHVTGADSNAVARHNGGDEHSVPGVLARRPVRVRGLSRFDDSRMGRGRAARGRRFVGCAAGRAVAYARRPGSGLRGRLGAARSPGRGGGVAQDQGRPGGSAGRGGDQGSRSPARIGRVPRTGGGGEKAHLPGRGRCAHTSRGDGRRPVGRGEGAGRESHRGRVRRTDRGPVAAAAGSRGVGVERAARGG
jgi:RNA polymerase sigma factor (sigma-70 family)